MAKVVGLDQAQPDTWETLKNKHNDFGDEHEAGGLIEDHHRLCRGYLNEPILTARALERITSEYDALKLDIETNNHNLKEFLKELLSNFSST